MNSQPRTPCPNPSRFPSPLCSSVIPVPCSRNTPWEARNLRVRAARLPSRAAARTRGTPASRLPPHLEFCAAGEKSIHKKADESQDSTSFPRTPPATSRARSRHDGPRINTQRLPRNCNQLERPEVQQQDQPNMPVHPRRSGSLAGRERATIHRRTAPSAVSSTAQSHAVICGEGTPCFASRKASASIPGQAKRKAMERQVVCAIGSAPSTTSSTSDRKK